MALNAFDLFVLVLAGLLALLGLLKGLTRLLIGIGALVAAFILAARLHPQVGVLFHGVVQMPEPLANLAGYLTIFLGTMLAGALLGRLLRGVLKAAMLGWADRLAGGVAGVAAALLAAALVLLPIIAYVPTGDRLLRGSVLAPYVAGIAALADVLAPEGFAERYEERIDALRRYWGQRPDETAPGVRRNRAPGADRENPQP